MILRYWLVFPVVCRRLVSAASISHLWTRTRTNRKFIFRRHSLALQISGHSAAIVAGFFMRGRMGGMRFRKLRIAWSVGCGIVCLLLAEI
jgi:hypothetical protein